MRMVIDLDDMDASTWNQLTGASGHAFHTNYTDRSAVMDAAGIFSVPARSCAITR